MEGITLFEDIGDRLMKKLSAVKKQEVSGGWRKSNKAELRDLCHGKTSM